MLCCARAECEELGVSGMLFSKALDRIHQSITTWGCQGKAQGNGTQKSKPSNNRYIEHGILSVVMLWKYYEEYGVCIVLRKIWWRKTRAIDATNRMLERLRVRVHNITHTSRPMNIYSQILKVIWIFSSFIPMIKFANCSRTYFWIWCAILLFQRWIFPDCTTPFVNLWR